MKPTPLSPNLQASVPELARQIGAILAMLAAVVARRFLREPRLVALIIPLYHRIMRVARRFERRLTGPVAAARASRARPGRANAKRSARLPSGRGWLVRELGYEAAGAGSQLEHLLRQPEMRAVIEAAPGVGRILRPICWMLGIGPEIASATPPVVLDAAGRVVPPRLPRPWPLAAPVMPAVAPWAEADFKTKFSAR